MFGNDWFVWKQRDSTSFLVVTHNLAQTFKMLFKHQGGTHDLNHVIIYDNLILDAPK